MSGTEDFIVASSNFVWRSLQQGTSLWRIGKTVYSPIPTGTRNYLSSFFNALTEGSIQRSDVMGELTASSEQGLRSAASEFVGRPSWMTPAEKAEEIAVAGRGLSNVDVRSQEAAAARALLSPGGLGGGPLAKWEQRARSKWADLTGDRWTRRRRRFANADRALRRFYVEGDVPYKKAIYRATRGDFHQSLKHGDPGDIEIINKFYRGGTAELMAEDYVKNVTQTYPRTSRPIQQLSRFPLMGTFVSFPYESTRNMYHHVRYMAADFMIMNTATSPVVKKVFAARFWRRLSGLSIAANMPRIVKGMYEASPLGQPMDKDTSAAFERYISADWDRDTTKLFSRTPEGNIKHYSFGNVDYFDSIRRSLSGAWAMAAAYAQGDQEAGSRKAIELFDHISSDFLAYEGLFKHALEEVFNQRIESNIFQTIRNNRNPVRPRQMISAEDDTKASRLWWDKRRKTLSTTMTNWSYDNWLKATGRPDVHGRVRRGSPAEIAGSIFISPSENTPIIPARSYAKYMRERIQSFKSALISIENDENARPGGVESLAREWNDEVRHEFSDIVHGFDFRETKLLTMAEFNEVFRGENPPVAHLWLFRGDHPPSFEKMFPQAKRIGNRSIRNEIAIAKQGLE